MADTIRESIIAAAMTQLAKITTANGYQYTMTTPKRGQKAIDVSYFPVSVVFPGTEENEQLYSMENLTFTLRVESHRSIGSGENASVIQEKMLGDLRKNLTNPDDATWAALTDDVVYLEGGPAEQPEAEDKTTAIYAVIQIKYVTEIGDPYNQ
jgi:hypothetical protein